MTPALGGMNLDTTNDILLLANINSASFKINLLNLPQTSVLSIGISYSVRR